MHFKILIFEWNKILTFNNLLNMKNHSFSYPNIIVAEQNKDDCHHLIPINSN